MAKITLEYKDFFGERTVSYSIPDTVAESLETIMRSIDDITYCDDWERCDE